MDYWPLEDASRQIEQTPVHGVWLGDGVTTDGFPTTMTAKQPQIDRAQKGDGSMAFVGRVTYSDMFGGRAETGFCWLWNLKTGRFTQAPGEGLNYNRQLDDPD